MAVLLLKELHQLGSRNTALFSKRKVIDLLYIQLFSSSLCRSAWFIHHKKPANRCFNSNRQFNGTLATSKQLYCENNFHIKRSTVQNFCSWNSEENEQKGAIVNTSFSEQEKRITDKGVCYPANSNIENGHTSDKRTLSDIYHNLCSSVEQNSQAVSSPEMQSSANSGFASSSLSSKVEGQIVLDTSFKQDTSVAQGSLTIHPLSDTDSISQCLDPTDVSELTPDQLPHRSELKENDDLEKLSHAKHMEPSYHLAPYVAQSTLLQQLVGLGVDLSAVEKVREAADFIVQADWDADIMPKLLFLRDIGLSDSQLGPVLNKNPLMLKEDIEDMQGRIDYFKSKKFSQDQITHIVTTSPLTLLLPVTYVDKKLGYLQKTFHLTGDEVRLVATKLPKIIPWKLQKLKDIRFFMKEMLGFSEKELKAMLVTAPRVYVSDKHQLGKRFDFLYNVMGLSHKHLSSWPTIFRTRLHILQYRHRFLLLLGRAQYDPTRENYVSLKALVSGKDEDFCSNVAKASTTQFHEFLKSL